jgi:hypothetical protein
MIVPTEVETSLPSIIKGLRLAAGTCFDPRRESGRYAIQRAMYLLRTLGYKPALRYVFKEHDGGPISNELARELERLDGSVLRSARPDLMIAEENPLLTTALSKGDRFVQVLGFSLSVRMRNPGETRDELIQFQSEMDPSLAPFVAEAWEFMEVTQWPLTIR